MPKPDGGPKEEEAWLHERAARELNGFQHAVIGSLSGMIEVMIQQPSIAIKNAIQQQRPIPLAPTVLYRGVGITLASIAPISAIQFSVNGMLLAWCSSRSSANTRASHTSGNTNDHHAIGKVQQLGIASIAGFCSALLSSPAELVMTCQQNSGLRMTTTIQQITQRQDAGTGGGILRLYRGFGVTAAREMIWCAAFLGLGPLFSQHLHDVAPNSFGTRHDATVSQRASASVVGSIVAGLVTVYATQPLDTIKTVMQGQALQRGVQKNTFQIARELMQHHGIQAFYRGAVPRGLRLIGAVFILGQSRNFFEQLFVEHHVLKSF